MITNYRERTWRERTWLKNLQPPKAKIEKPLEQPFIWSLLGLQLTSEEQGWHSIQIKLGKLVPYSAQIILISQRNSVAFRLREREREREILFLRQCSTLLPLRSWNQAYVGYPQRRSVGCQYRIKREWYSLVATSLRTLPPFLVCLHLGVIQIGSAID